MFKYTVDELWQLKGFSDNIREAEHKNVYPLTAPLLAQMVHRQIDFIKRYPNDADHIFDAPYSSPCGCMGAQWGELFCGCTMRHLMYEYRYDIAITILNIMDCVKKNLSS